MSALLYYVTPTGSPNGTGVRKLAIAHYSRIHGKPPEYAVFALVAEGEPMPQPEHNEIVYNQHAYAIPVHTSTRIIP